MVLCVSNQENLSSLVASDTQRIPVNGIPNYLTASLPLSTPAGLLNDAGDVLRGLRESARSRFLSKFVDNLWGLSTSP